MTLDARKIALQGIGYGPLPVALQGLFDRVSVAQAEVGGGGNGGGVVSSATLSMSEWLRRIEKQAAEAQTAVAAPVPLAAPIDATAAASAARRRRRRAEEEFLLLMG